MSAQSTALNASSVSYRANLYRLAEGNSWTLIGAGLCVYTEVSRGLKYKGDSARLQVDKLAATMVNS